MSIRLLILLVLLSFMNSAKAAFFMGAEVSYRHLNALSYEIKVVYYRDCRGIPFNGQPAAYVYNDSLTYNLSLTRVKIEEVISPLCKGACISNTTSGQGTEAHTFLDTIDFNVAPYTNFGSSRKPLVYFAISQCCRNGGITTYPAGNAFVNSMLNLYYAKNVSAEIGFNDYMYPVEPYIFCGQNFHYSYKTLPKSIKDSLAYQLVKPMEDFNTYANMDPYKPLRYYCGNPNTTTCTANTQLFPVRGFYFDTQNGNLLTAPIYCSDMGTMVGEVDIYRTLNGQKVLVGFKKRDMQFIVATSPDNTIPYIQKNKDYTIKAREEFCVDIPIKDVKTSLQTLSDTVIVQLMEAPKYGSISLLDSNAREKTLHYCWNPKDSDYLKHHSDYINFRVFEKNCTRLKINAIATTVNFVVVAPDSLTTVFIKTYNDWNKNGIRDNNEPFVPAQFYSNSNNLYQRFTTDSSGKATVKALYGIFDIGIPEQLEYIFSGNPVKLTTKFDSSYTVELGLQYRHGVKGRVYEDVNNNCKFDNGDIALGNQKILIDNQNTVYTNASGLYFAQASFGTHTLQLAGSNPYASSCIASYNVLFESDSLKKGYDFAVKKRPNVKDIGVELVTTKHLTQNQIMTQDIQVRNNGFKTEKFVKVNMMASRKLLSFNSPSTYFKVVDTFTWIIDSIPKGSIKTIQFKQTMTKDSFISGDAVCYTLWLDEDSVKDNNYFNVCETYSDTLFNYPIKSSRSSKEVTEVEGVLNYRITHFRSASSHRSLIVKDTLDAIALDLSSFKVTSSSPCMKVNLIDNVVFIEYTSDLTALTEYFTTFTVKVKRPLYNRIVVENTAFAQVDFEPYQASQKVTNYIVPNIVIVPLADSQYCVKDVVTLLLNNTIPVKNTLKYEVYLSDGSGSFSNPLKVLDTSSNRSALRFKFKLPSTLSAGANYKLRVVCPALNIQTFDEDFKQSIDVYTLPMPTVTSNLIKGALCKEDTLKLQAITSDSMYFVYNTYALTNFTDKKFVRFVPSQPGNFGVVARDANGCINASPLTSFVLNELPKLNIKASPEVCYGKTSVLQLQGAKSFEVYQNSINWMSNADTGTYTSNNLTESSRFRVVGRDTNGCMSEDSVLTKVNALPLKPIIYAEKLRMYSSYPIRNQWYIGSSKIDSAIYQYFYPPIYGKYSVEYTDTKGCKSISEAYDYKYVNLIDVNATKALNVYPNPTTDVLYMDIPNDASMVRIVAADGRLVMTYEANRGKQKVQIDLLSKGVYSIIVVDGVNTYTSQFVKE